MKTLLLFQFLLVLSLTASAQHHSTPVLELDGIDDYINLGAQAGNGIRTIELWFQVEDTITPQLADFATLAATEISSTAGNTGEFSFSFQPAHVPFSGKLRFDIDGTFPHKSVYSNNDTWYPNQWYHVAAVIDPVDGMALFVNGIKQNSTHAHTGATATSSHITTIGCWGDLYQRFFKGKIDDVRLSSQALYTANFTPTCPNAVALSSTIGLWNFNEGIGSNSSDAGNNSYTAQINGAVWGQANICAALNSTKLGTSNSLLTVAPNPSNAVFYFELKTALPVGSSLLIYNTTGQLVYQQLVNSPTFEVSLEGQEAGLYYYQLLGEDSKLAGALLKK